MGQYHLDRIFKPKSIAVIGADGIPGTIGHAILANLIKSGYEGSLFPINPNHKVLLSQKAYKSVRDIEAGIDLAVILSPIETVPDMIDECCAGKVGGAIIISGRNKTNNENYEKIENRIRLKAYEGGLRIMGPECLGMIQPGLKLNASLAAEMPNEGNLAFVSQSGAICTAVLDLALHEQFGFSHFVDIGNMLDVDFGDMIDYLGSDRSTKSIILYMERLTHIRKFMSAARSVSRIKPIIVLKAGRSATAAGVAVSHLGTAAEEDAVYGAAFKRAGIVRVNTIEELFDCAELAARRSRPSGPRLAIITNGKGPGLMATDALRDLGHQPAVLNSETRQTLDKYLTVSRTHNNPINIGRDAAPESFQRVLEICFEAREVDAVLVIMSPFAQVDPTLYAQTLTSVMKAYKNPVFTCWMGGKRIAGAMQMLNQAGIPTYETPERAVRAFLYMVQYSRNLEALQQVPPKLSKNISFDLDLAGKLIAHAPVDKWMSAQESKAILAAYGLPIVPAKTEKTDQPFPANSDYEVALGATRDAGFGPVIRFGLGGIFTGSKEDLAVGLPPMNRLLARRLIQEAKVSALMIGDENRQPTNLEQLEEIIIRLSQLLIDFPDLAELDINPLQIKNNQVLVFDTRIRFSSFNIPSPHHLVISPYPAEYEAYKTVKDNTRIFIRPVKPEDAPLFTDLFTLLSPTSIYYRFFSPMKQLRPDMLARFTQIDYDRDIALVALDADVKKERMYGVARIMGDADGKSGEFAVLVGDPWHGKGIGAVLLQKCLDIAKSRGFSKIMGFVLKENRGMVGLGKKLGFIVNKSEECDEYELIIRW